MNLLLLPGRYAVCRLDEAPPIDGKFFALTRTEDELSVICEERLVPDGARHEPGWRVLRFEGTFSFTETGVLASVALPLKEAGVPILAVSTFDTDYLLVKDSDLSRAESAVTVAGHKLLGW